MRAGCVYILASKSGIFYTGVTSSPDRRFWQHLIRSADGFTKKYHVNRIVYYETFGDIRAAIAREKQIKHWIRRKKIALIKSMNPTWRDLSIDLFPNPSPL